MLIRNGFAEARAGHPVPDLRGFECGTFRRIGIIHFFSRTWSVCHEIRRDQDFRWKELLAARLLLGPF